MSGNVAFGKSWTTDGYRQIAVTFSRLAMHRQVTHDLYRLRTSTSAKRRLHNEPVLWVIEKRLIPPDIFLGVEVHWRAISTPIPLRATKLLLAHIIARQESESDEATRCD